VPVSNRSRQTLIPIIKQYVLPGTTIVSDCWKVRKQNISSNLCRSYDVDFFKAYDSLAQEGYKHFRATIVDTLEIQQLVNTPTQSKVCGGMLNVISHNMGEKKKYFTGYLKEKCFIRTIFFIF